MHGIEFTVVVITCVALLSGALMRQLSRKAGFPYTIGMLLLGMGAGLLIHGMSDGNPHGLFQVVDQGARLAPDLILFVFLPALVFESAFAVDVNQFRKSVGAVVLYAVPVLVLSTLILGALLVLLTRGSWQWGWITALVFGALISATDPVAVVAIFSELGVSKRLGVLVEGESLLNDGTAIVVFSLLMRLLTGEMSEFSTVEALGRFAVVVAGGVGVGLVFSALLSRWIGVMFNDPLSEITLTLVLAYACMATAEGVFHVSGVMAVVTAGLWMSANGKRTVSPEITEFLHRFWHMLGYVANTLIFFLVGLLIAKELEMARLADFVLILVVYVVVMVVRGLLTYAAQPLANRLSDGVNGKDSAVITWGGLRGAVSLALALMVAQNPDVAPSIRQQLLLLTAGVVFLTIFVNGGTVARLLKQLGYDRPPLFEQLAALNARGLVLSRTGARIDEVAQDRGLRTVDWSEVRGQLAERQEQLEDERRVVTAELDRASHEERVTFAWGQVLDIELQSYWESFAEGTLGAVAVKLLAVEVSRQRDRLARGELEPPLSRTAEVSGEVFRWRRRSLNFDQVALRYDLWRAEAIAAQRVLANLGVLGSAEPQTVAAVRATYLRYQRDSKERLEDLRTNLPEMASAVETRLARRIQLNFEREELSELERRGVLDATMVEAELHSIESRMKALRHLSERVEIPETADLVAKTPLFRELDEAALQQLAVLTEEMLLPPGATLFRQGDPGDALYVIARGAVQILIQLDGEETLVDVLGGGDVVGEMALLTGASRSATARASTSVTLGKIDRQRFQRLLQEVPSLEADLWSAFAERAFDNHVRVLARYAHLTQADRIGWARSGHLERLSEGASHTVRDGVRHVFLVHGRATSNGVPLASGELSDCVPQDVVRVEVASALLFLPLDRARE